MCGIWFLLGLTPDHSCEYCIKRLEAYKDALDRRGPDACNTIKRSLANCPGQVAAHGSVLWLQGAEPTVQPVVNSSGGLLLWNGDILAGYQIPEGQSDSSFLAELLNDASKEEMLQIFSEIKGPWSMVYYDGHRQHLYFGRDVIGRHSLLWSQHRKRNIEIAGGDGTENVSGNCDSRENVKDQPRFVDGSIYGRSSRTFNELIITSVGNGFTDLEEIPAYGIYFIDLSNISMPPEDLSISLFPWDTVSSKSLQNLDVIIMETKLPSPIKRSLNTTLPDSSIDTSMKDLAANFDAFDSLVASSDFDVHCDELWNLLTQSVQRRTDACPRLCNLCGSFISSKDNVDGSRLPSKSVDSSCVHSRIAVLFSGGLDSTVLTLLLHKCLPEHESIDLINVAFPQKVARPNSSHKKGKKINAKSANVTDTSTRLINNSESQCSRNSSGDEVHYNVPDRLTGISSYDQLTTLCPSRKFNFIRVDVTAEELKEARTSRVQSLLAPHRTVLDDSIGCALWFAARGIGTLGAENYTCHARVIFSGLGADELLCGYSRHRSVFNSESWAGLIAEVSMEVARLHERNCGRDNRVMADHARAPRFPYLDEDVVSYLQQLNMWEKCNLYLPRGLGEKLLLRVLAHRKGLTCAAVMPKRAIQFGSRIAKMEDRKEKGNQQCGRLASQTLNETTASDR